MNLPCPGRGPAVGADGFDLNERNCCNLHDLTLVARNPPAASQTTRPIHLPRSRPLCSRRRAARRRTRLQVVRPVAGSTTAPAHPTITSQAPRGARTPRKPGPQLPSSRHRSQSSAGELNQGAACARGRMMKLMQGGNGARCGSERTVREKIDAALEASASMAGAWGAHSS